MARYEEIDSKQSSLGPHRDYNANLSQANYFCSNVKKSLLKGMSVKVCDSHGLNNSLLMISYIPEKTAKIGNFVTPICLHQASSDFNKKIECVFNSYMSMVKNYLNSSQGNLFDASKKC